MTTLYGISNCDSVKKAVAWLKRHKIEFRFHDYKTSGITGKKLSEWLASPSSEIVLNKKSTAWRELSATQQQQAATKDGAIMLMKEYNNLIKRPVLEITGTVLIGFSEDKYKKAFKLQ